MDLTTGLIAGYIGGIIVWWLILYLFVPLNRMTDEEIIGACTLAFVWPIWLPAILTNSVWQYWRRSRPPRRPTTTIETDGRDFQVKESP